MTKNLFKTKLQKYYLEEIYFVADYHQSNQRALSLLNKILDKKLRSLLQNGFEVGKHVNEDSQIDLPFDGDCEDQNTCRCDYVWHSYRFLIVLDKKFKAKLNYDKKYIYKLLTNKQFRADFVKLNFKANYELDKAKSCSATASKGMADFYDLLLEYDIPAKYEYVVKKLMNNDRAFKNVLDNLDDLIMENITYQGFYNKLVYLYGFHCGSSDGKSFNTIKVEYDGLVDKKDVKDSYLMIEYLQNKYMRGSKNRVGFDFDLYYQLKKLDVNKPEMPDWQKHDTLFNTSFDPAYDKLPSKEEDEAKKRVIRDMRRRYKLYFK